MKRHIFIPLLLLFTPLFSLNSYATPPTLTPVSTEITGWARTSVNAVIFRKDPIASNGDTQYIAYYDAESRVVLGKRKLGKNDWTLRTTEYSGNTKDAHNTISIIVDGDGYLHMSWDHHGQKLNYVKSTAPGSLELSKKLSMTGEYEERVTYPEFFNLPDGGLICMYRDGSSGNGITMINRYNRATKSWRAVQHPLIDGEGLRNAYTNQIAIDANGGLHISWCWRETGGVQTNHDIGYAYSPDGGEHWLKSTGEKYSLPITYQNAEYVVKIPQKRELINHTSMTVDNENRPVIATYFRPRGTKVPQYHVLRFDGEKWHTIQVGNRTTPFTLSGGGTKRIPISRPKVLIDRKGRLIVIFRDVERMSRISAAIGEGFAPEKWEIIDLAEMDVGLWEPSYDTALWQREGVIHLFVQRVGQGDGESLENVAPQTVHVLEWKPE